MNPKLLLGGPSSASFDGDDWSHLLDHVYPFVLRPMNTSTLSRTPLHGRPQQYSASFDVFQNMVTQATGKRIQIWNTEANDLVDQPGAWNQGEGFHEDGVNRRRFVYNLGDILLALKYHNDIKVGRAIHALWRGEFKFQGEAWAYQIVDGLKETSSTSRLTTRISLQWSARDENQGSVVIYNDGPTPLMTSLKGLGGLASSYDMVYLSEDGHQYSKGLPLEPEGTHYTRNTSSIGGCYLA